MSHAKARSKLLAQVMSFMALEFAAERSLRGTDADKLVEGRGGARFVLAVRARCHG